MLNVVSNFAFKKKQCKYSYYFHFINEEFESEKWSDIFSHRANNKWQVLNLSPASSNFRILTKQHYSMLPLFNFHLLPDSLPLKYSSLCFLLHLSIKKLVWITSKNNVQRVKVVTQKIHWYIAYHHIQNMGTCVYCKHK